MLILIYVVYECCFFRHVQFEELVELVGPVYNFAFYHSKYKFKCNSLDVFQTLECWITISMCSTMRLKGVIAVCWKDGKQTRKLLKFKSTCTCLASPLILVSSFELPTFKRSCRMPLLNLPLARHSDVANSSNFIRRDLLKPLNQLFDWR